MPFHFPAINLDPIIRFILMWFVGGLMLIFSMRWMLEIGRSVGAGEPHSRTVDVYFIFSFIFAICGALVWRYA